MRKAKPFEISQKEVLEAYKKVKANKSAPGIDGVSFEEYENDLKNRLYKLWNRMSSGSYFPQAVKGVSIPKKSGNGVRILGVPTIDDRVAQMVMVTRLSPMVEPIFHPDSYGYRPGKSAIDAVRITRDKCWKYDWLIEFDIVGLFDNIDHSLLMMLAHTTIVFMRYSMLALESRNSKDPRTIGDLFYYMCDEAEDIKLTASIMLVL